MFDAPVVDEVVLTDEEKKAAAEAAAADAELEAGYADDQPTETTPPAEEADEAAKAAAEKEAADKAAAEAAAAAAAAAATTNAPVYRQVTEAEWTELRTGIDQIKADSRKELDKAFGKVGGLERTLATLQAATPAGYAVDVTDEVVAELAEQFPELGGLTLKAFKAFAGKLKGTAPAPAAATAPDPKAIEETVHARVIALQSEELEDARPNWREIVGAPDAKTPYRTWLATQPEAYRAKLAATNSAGVIARSIDRFEAAQAAASKEAAAAAEKAAAAAKIKADADKRRGVIAAAVSPRGTGGHTAPAPSADDEFDEGYKEG